MYESEALLPTASVTVAVKVCEPSETVAPAQSAVVPSISQTNDSPSRSSSEDTENVASASLVS